MFNIVPDLSMPHNPLCTCYECLEWKDEEYWREYDPQNWEGRWTEEETELDWKQFGF